MSTEFSSSELIYLFLDGEHTSVERSVLFKAMAEDQDLQHEFEDALNIRNAALRESQEIAPSAELGRSLMARAGFAPLIPAGVGAGAAAASASSGAPAAVSGGFMHGLVSHWSNVALLCALPLIGMWAGYSLNSTKPSSDTTGIENKLSSEYSANSAVNGSNSNSNSNTTDRLSLLQQITAQRNDIAELETKIDQTQRAMSVLQRAAKSNNLRSSSSQFATNSADHQLNANAGIREAAQTASQIAARELPTPISSVSARDNAAITSNAGNSSNAAFASNHSNGGQIVTDRYALPTMNLQIGQAESAPQAFAPSTWKFELRGVQSIQQTLDDRVNSADAHNIGNFSAALLFQYNESLSFVLSGGRENFATLYFPNSSVGFGGSGIVQQNIVWATAGARLTSSLWSESLPVRGFVQASVGACDLGAMARLFPGVEWQPDTRVSFVAGLEQTMLIPTSAKVNSIGNKTSYSYGVRINF